MSLEHDINTKRQLPKIIKTSEGAFCQKNGQDIPDEEIIGAAQALVSCVRDPFQQSRKIRLAEGSGTSRREIDRAIATNRSFIAICDYAIQIIKSRYGHDHKVVQYHSGYRQESQQLVDTRKILSGLQTLNRAALKR